MLKKKLLTAEEEREINQLRPDEQAPRLVAMVGKKGMRSIGVFADCLKQSRENEKLWHLFDIASGESPGEWQLNLHLPSPPTARKKPTADKEKTGMYISLPFSIK